MTIVATWTESESNSHDSADFVWAELTDPATSLRRAFGPFQFNDPPAVKNARRQAIAARRIHDRSRSPGIW